MIQDGRPRILLTGTPNSGKTTLFNRLTGLNHQTANFPGVTTAVAEGRVRLISKEGVPWDVACLDLPGIYSLYPDTPDEEEAVRCLRHALALPGPQCVVFVADPTTPQRTLHLLQHLLRYVHIHLVVFNFWDVAEKEGIRFDKKAFRALFGDSLRIAFHNPRNHVHLRQIRKALAEALEDGTAERSHPLLHGFSKPSPDVRISQSTRDFNLFQEPAQRIFRRTHPGERAPVSRLDRILLHPVWGTLLFITSLFLIFQAIFSWSAYPMAAIEWAFRHLGLWLRGSMPPGALSDLVSDGLVQGLSGIFVFVPQIAFLLLFIAGMEESGYMARAVALMDRLMRRFGLSGRSVVPLLGGAACAVPSILATRAIPHPTRRLITLLVIPLMSCSARLPVYTMLIGLLFPQQTYWGLDVRGLALMGMYVAGFGLAVGAAFLLSRVLPGAGRDYLIMSLPHLQRPKIGVVLAKTWNGLKGFIIGAGKIILLISIILWGLMRYGPGTSDPSGPAVLNLRPVEAVDQSWAAFLGRAIEPAIEPMGGDWRIGIAIISSFAAREVFSGTLATLFPPPPGVGLRAHLGDLRYPDGRRVFSAPACIALLIFYALALQCMSTVATVYHETRSLRWPLLQFLTLSLCAWVAAVAAYQLSKGLIDF